MKNYSEMIKKNRLIFSIIRMLKFGLTFVLIFIFVFYGIHAATRMFQLHDTSGLIYSSLLFIFGVAFLIFFKHLVMTIKMKQILKYFSGETLNPPEKYEERFFPHSNGKPRGYNPFILWRKKLNGYNVQLERFYCKGNKGTLSMEKMIFRITQGSPRFFELYPDFTSNSDSDVEIEGQKFLLNCKAYDGMLEQFFTSEHEWIDKMMKLFVEIDPEAVIVGTKKSLLFACDFEAFLAYSFTTRKVREIFDLLKTISDDLKNLPPVEVKYDEGTGVLNTKFL